MAQLDTFWQMVVIGLIILIAVVLGIVRQSRDPEVLRKLFASIGAAMVFFTLLTPASVFIRAKIVLMELEAMTALLRVGEKLAMGQNNRLLTTNEIENV